jgi:hypothetical protein
MSEIERGKEREKERERERKREGKREGKKERERRERVRNRDKERKKERKKERAKREILIIPASGSGLISKSRRFSTCKLVIVESGKEGSGEEGSEK